MVEVSDVTGLCNTVYSFFLRQIYWHIPVKMELWSSITVSPCRLQFSLDICIWFWQVQGFVVPGAMSVANSFRCFKKIASMI